MRADYVMAQALMHSGCKVRAHRKIAAASQLSAYQRGELGKVLEVLLTADGKQLVLSCSNGSIVLEIDQKHGRAAFHALQQLECNLPDGERLDMDHGPSVDQSELNGQLARKLIV
jgi:hypothetical protein